MLHRTEVLLRQGIGPGELQRMVERGEMVRVRRGVYADGPLTEDPRIDHLTRARAAALTLSDNKVFSHQTAGVLHDLPVWRPSLARVVATRPGRSGGRTRHDLIIRVAPLPDQDVTEINGLKVTSLARTVADLSRECPLLWGLPAVDAALRKGATPGQLAAQADAARRWPGVRTFKAALDLADGRAESAGESISRLVLFQLGLPTPVLQQDIAHSRTGKFLARPDFCWPDLRIVGEFDGKVKYSCGLDNGNLDDIVLREKRREHDLRADGWTVIRWIWAELFERQSIWDQWLLARRAAA